jgi:hypothetical protein
MNKKFCISLVVILMLGLISQVFAQNVQTNTASENTNVNQFVSPGATGYGGTTNNTSPNPSRIPRTWFNPMILPGVSGPLYYGGPVRFGKELLDVGIIIRFKPVWDSSFAQQFARNRPGKVNVSESVPTPKNGMSSTAVTMTMRQPQSEKKVKDFNRSYELLDCYSVEGTDGADSPKLLGMAAEKANLIGADLGIIANQGANFELFAKDKQQVIGFSPTIMGGGAGSVSGGALGFAIGWAQHRAKYLTQPFLVVLLFRSTGVPYNWDGGEPPPEKKPHAAVPGNGFNQETGEHYEEGGASGRDTGAKGARDVAPAKGSKLPYKRPSPELLIEQQPRRYNQ